MVGASPNFSKIHMLRALFYLNNKDLSRKKLVELLGIGEGSVRTLIKRLTELGLVMSKTSGHSLSDEGKDLVKKINTRLTSPYEIENDLIGGRKSLIIIKAGAKNVGSGVNARDSALKAGADGALILTYLGGAIRFPTEDPGMNPFNKGVEIASLDSLEEGDTIIIGFSTDYSLAEDGALNAALAISEDVLGWF